MQTKHWGGIVLALAMAMTLPATMATPLAADSHAFTSEKPGGYNYLVSTVVVDVDGTLTLTNVDLRSHDIESVAKGPSTNAWCGRYASGACPLFASPLIGLGEQAVVEGTDQLTPLESYEFFCSIHPWMTGTLTAI